MRKKFALPCIFFILALLALPLTGRDSPPWEGSSVLLIKVKTPDDGATVHTPTVTVSGRLGGTQTKGVQFKMNDADVPLKDNQFSSDITLTEGKNVIQLTAACAEFNTSKQLVVNYATKK